MTLEFFMAMDPPTATDQEHQVMMKNGKPVFYRPDRVSAARTKLIGYLGKYIPEEKMDGPIELVTKWCFPKTGIHAHGEYRITKPDTDNLQKMLKDCMTECGYWKDDALVCREITEKFWSDVPGIFIRVSEL